MPTELVLNPTVLKKPSLALICSTKAKWREWRYNAYIDSWVTQELLPKFCRYKPFEMELYILIFPKLRDTVMIKARWKKNLLRALKCFVIVFGSILESMRDWS